MCFYFHYLFKLKPFSSLINLNYLDIRNVTSHHRPPNLGLLPTIPYLTFISVCLIFKIHQFTMFEQFLLQGNEQFQKYTIKININKNNNMTCAV